MARVCQEITEKIEETVWEPVEEWVERRVKKCKKKKCKKWCLCCNKWFCWIETFIEKVVTWVAKTVVKFVTKTVCEIVTDILKFVADLVVAVVNILVDIVRIVWNVITLDWDGVRDAWKDLIRHIVDLGPVILKFLRLLLAAVTFGAPYWLGYIRDEIHQWRLKRYIRERLDKKFSDDPDRLMAIKDGINLDHGPFGLDFRGNSIRTYVDSRTTPEGSTVPTLLTLHQNGDINLFVLTGINVDNYLDRPRVEAYLIDGEVPIDHDDIEEYINSNGAGPHFRVYAFSPSAHTQKLNVAEEKGRQVGLKFNWGRTTQEVTGIDQITVLNTAGRDFLENPIGRAPDSSDVCEIAAAGVFNIAHASGRNPFGWGYPFSSSGACGVIHRDRHPAEFLKYVLVHEAGHYFNLGHEGHDGLDKIMFSPVENGWWSWNLILEFLVWSGEPRFTLDDGKRVWDFLIDEISHCLPGKPSVNVGVIVQ